MRIGMVDYINTLPFTAAWSAGALETPGELVMGVPTQLNRWMLSGDVDVALMSAAEYLRNRDQLQLVRGPCIAASRHCCSVLLHLTGDLSSLHERTIYVTPDTASSLQLLRVLCHHFWHVSPEFVIEPEPMKQDEAYLTIGDEALQLFAQGDKHIIDLAQAWYYASGLPFTFAVLAARRSLSSSECEEIGQAFAASLAWAQTHKERVICSAAHASGLSHDILETYFSSLTYTSSLAHCRGMQRFDTLCNALPNEALAV